ncbi:hypothetical protein DL98DRAFT_585303 [Cadophora sp. DSE1049]|nr:hypothetical protein DL98DRAFT_585303 [Cadophora sp. DSE1049]
MQLSHFISTFLALASTAAAVPAPQAIECYSTCSTNCVRDGNLRGGICDAAGTCTCLTGTKRSAEPEPQTPEIECWKTCGTSCLQAGNLRGGLCDDAGTCTCLTGTGASKRSPEPIPAPQSPQINCWSTCSTGCVQAGNLRGGLCDAAGTCTCLTKREAGPAPEPEPEPQSAVVDCYTNCSVGCINDGHIRGGVCDAAGTCTCYE